MLFGPPQLVSMKSGLEGRNNVAEEDPLAEAYAVSMKSGLEGRNNWFVSLRDEIRKKCLNEVRPGRPEQFR